MRLPESRHTIQVSARNAQPVLAAAAAVGVIKPRELPVEIYYFSGTGNSLHVAKELASRFADARLIPMVGLMREAGPDGRMTTTSKTVGLVFPVHLSTMPYPVKDFVERMDFASAEYVFAALTRIGTVSYAEISLSRLLEHKGKALEALFYITMAANSPCGVMPKSFPGFKRMTEEWVDRIAAEKLEELERGVQRKLDTIQETVAARRQYRDGHSPFARFGNQLMAFLLAPTEASSRKQRLPFYADHTCTGCGICAEVCLSGRVVMEDGKPAWRDPAPCYLCYACFNSCPEQAILIEDRYDRKLGRYLHPEIQPSEIAAQKLHGDS